MSAKSDLIEFLFAGNANPLKNVIVLTGTAIPTATTYPRGTFCVIDYPGDDSNHDVYIYGQATLDTNSWILIHNEV